MVHQAGSVTVFETRPERLEIAKSYGPEFCFDPYSKERTGPILKPSKKQGGGRYCLSILACILTAVTNGVPSLTADTAASSFLGTWPIGAAKDCFDGTRWHLSGFDDYESSHQASNRHFREMIPLTARAWSE